ncbi:MAG: hypothetical protein WDM87_04665 [Terracidiphilus sp.]
MSLRTESRLFGVEVEAGEKAVGQFNTLLRVLSGAAAFAGVMQKQREKKEVEAIDFRKQLGETLLLLAGGRAQLVDIVDDEEGVLVDGVAVVAVADDERVDAVELGDEHLEGRRARAWCAMRAQHGGREALRAARSRDKDPREWRWRGREARR